MQAIRKPSWLKRETFEALLDQASPLPHCKECSSVDDLTVDHIVPRYCGGTDDLDNLQILCRRDNSAKGIRPDKHWSGSFYWDQKPDAAGFEHLRQSQRDLFDQIVNSHGEYFGRPFSEVSRYIYLCAMVVGAGKTLAIAVAAWALSHIVLRDHGRAHRRVDRILVLAKEQAIRDQLASDLKRDLVELKIMGRAPRVGVVFSGEQWKQTAWLDDHDIIVSCVEQLWEKKGAPRTDLHKVLAEFPMIAVDEPHFGPEQVDKLVDAATTSVVFGFTGTPIDGAGCLLQRMILLSLYSYQDADLNDKSLKFLDASEEHFTDWFVKEIDIENARVMDHGQHIVAENTNQDGYSKNIEPAKAVVWEVLAELRDRDLLDLSHEDMAPHRIADPDLPVKIGLHYPGQTVIYCDSIKAAEDLNKNTNRMFDEDRGKWPKADGWNSEVVHAGSGSGDDQRIPPKPLTDDHPWRRAYQRGGALDARCARVVFCVGMVREGINLPYTAVIGVAGQFNSILAVVQGWIGRQLRAVTKIEDGALVVPPAPLDRVRIITHSAYKNAELIRQGISFIIDMHASLKDLRTIDEIDEKPFEEPKDIEPKLVLTGPEKIAIAGYIQEAEDEGWSPSLDDILVQFPPSSPKKKKLIEEWFNTVRTKSPHELRQELRLNRDITPIPIVLREKLRYDATDEELERHAKIHCRPIIDTILPVSRGDNRRILAHFKQQHDEAFQHPPLVGTTTLSNQSRQIGNEVKGTIGRYASGDVSREYFSLATSAVKQKLGVPAGTVMRNFSDWDTPQAHALIRRPEVHSELVSWVIGRIIDKGYCPALRRLAMSGTEDE